jgi:hypothetical protein
MLIMNQVSTYELQDDDAVFVGHRSKNGEKPGIEETKSSKKEKKKQGGMLGYMKSAFVGK